MNISWTKLWFNLIRNEHEKELDKRSKYHTLDFINIKLELYQTATCPMKSTAFSILPSELTAITTNCWMCTFISAFPMHVAPKNVLNGTRKCPHVMPARSNNGFGI